MVNRANEANKANKAKRENGAYKTHENVRKSCALFSACRDYLLGNDPIHWFLQDDLIMEYFHGNVHGCS